MTLTPRASKPRVTVIVLTQHTHRRLAKLAKNNGAYVYFLKQHTTGEDLNRAIQRAVALVGQMPKEERHRTVLLKMLHSYALGCHFATEHIRRAGSH